MQNIKIDIREKTEELDKTKADYVYLVFSFRHVPTDRQFFGYRKLYVWSHPRHLESSFRGQLKKLIGNEFLCQEYRETDRECWKFSIVKTFKERGDAKAFRDQLIHQNKTHDFRFGFNCQWPNREPLQLEANSDVRPVEDILDLEKLVAKKA